MVSIFRFGCVFYFNDKSLTGLNRPQPIKCHSVSVPIFFNLIISNEGKPNGILVAEFPSEFV
jgi:hypothetical protein